MKNVSGSFYTVFTAAVLVSTPWFAMGAQEDGIQQHLYNVGKHQMDECTGAGHPLSQGEFELSSDFASKYVSRGVAINHEAVIQPRARVCWQGVELAIWANLDLTDANGHDNQFQEIDYTLSYCRAFKDLGVVHRLTLTGGVICYEFPDTADPTQELFVCASLDEWFLKPTLTTYYDFNAADGLYLNATIEHTFATPWERAALTIKGGLGWGDDNFNGFNMGMEQTHAGIMEASLSATLDIKVAEGIICGPFVAWSGVPDSRIRAAAQAQDREHHAHHVWYGVGISAVF
jgi:hypothetical protein